MFRVLLATDGSEDAVDAARFATSLIAKPDEAEVIALYVKDLGPLLMEQAREHPLEMASGILEIEQELDRDAQSALGSVQEVMEAAGVKVQPVQVWGRPSDVICDVAHKQGVSLIVMGHQGKHQIGSLILGSVSDSVVHRCGVPVLIVPKA